MTRPAHARRLGRLLLVVGCLLLVVPGLARAWVSMGFQTFPGGDAPVIVDPFCMSAFCGELPRAAWRDRVLRAMAAWNTANTGFTFSEVPESFPNEPCQRIRWSLDYPD